MCVPTGTKDFPKLLTAFQQYFRENSKAGMGSGTYRASGAQLLMQTFLHRIINGGGRIGREHALGRGRVDLCVQWPLDPAGSTDRCRRSQSS
jgi:hypothetical protein